MTRTLTALAFSTALAFAWGCDGFYFTRGRAVTDDGLPVGGVHVTVRMSPTACEGGWPAVEAQTLADGVYRVVMAGAYPMGDWDPDKNLLSVEFTKPNYQKE